MSNQDIFNQLFQRLSVEKQRELLSFLKDLEQADKGEAQEDKGFANIDYRDLYYTLYFHVGQHVDSLIKVLQQLEEQHLQEPEPGTIIDLHPEPEDE